MQRFAGFLSAAATFAVGALFLAVGLLFFLNFRPESYDVSAVATIAEIEESYDHSGDEAMLRHTVYVDYDTPGGSFRRVPLGQYHSGMKVGDTVQIYCRSDDPSQIAGPDKDLMPYISLAFAGVGFVTLALAIRRAVRRREPDVG